MPRYLVERSFPDGLAIPVDEGGATPPTTGANAARGRITMDGEPTSQLDRGAPNDAVVDDPSKFTFLCSYWTEGACGHAPGIAIRDAG
jgi:hypothetical protein